MVNQTVFVASVIPIMQTELGVPTNFVSRAELLQLLHTALSADRSELVAIELIS